MAKQNQIYNVYQISIFLNIWSH